jgi:hypothetical protein
MKASELRIGNYVLLSGQLHKIIELLENESSCEWLITSPDIMIDNYLYEEIKPIPLTEDWLVRFGFTNTSSNIIHRRKDFNLPFFNLTMYNEDISFSQNGFKIIVKHVHQLQNLYFALTQKELEIK